MSTGGGNLFGTRIIWMRILAIAVIFTAWSQIISCNEANDAKKETATNNSMATTDGAIEYCSDLLRDSSEGGREQFAITDASATRRATHTHFDVIVEYTYFDGYRKKTRDDSYNCAAGYSGEWRRLRSADPLEDRLGLGIHTTHAVGESSGLGQRMG